MPTGWVPAEVAFDVAGVKVYHCYKDGWRDNPPLQFRYTTDSADDPLFEFDVRDLPQWRVPEFDQDHRGIIKSAIETGYINP